MAIGAFAVGLIDDIRGVPAPVKLACLVLTSAVLCAAGVRFDSIRIGDWLSMDLGWLGWPLTILWIVGVTVGINFIDGLDGLAAGISAIACGTVGLLALFKGEPVMGVLMFAMLGSLSGFLFFNFNPARVFMGDCGSMFLGFVIGSASVFSTMKTETFVGIALPALALGIPIFDSVFTVLRRGVLERRSIFGGGRGHVHHRLLNMGLHQRQVVIILYIVTSLAVGLGMFMMAARGAEVLVIFLGVLLLLMLLFRAVGSIHVGEMFEAIGRNRTISRQARQERGVFEDAQLHLREVRTFDDWWQIVCDAAQSLKIARLTLSIPNRDGSTRTLHGERGDHEAISPLPHPHPKTIRMTMPIPDRRDGPPLVAELDVTGNGSLEAAGRQGALFGRLIDEHSVATLPVGENGERRQATISSDQPSGAGAASYQLSVISYQTMILLSSAHPHTDD